MARLMKSARGILALVVSFSLALVLGLVPMTSANAAEIAISGMPKRVHTCGIRRRASRRKYLDRRSGW